MCGLSGEFFLRIMLLNIVYFKNNFVSCEELTNTVFNANIRDYSVKEDETNATNVRTLQKEEVGRYANFAPIRNPIRFKEIPDNALSSSSYSRGLLQHEHIGHEGYGLHDGFYDDGSHYGHGYEYGHDDDHHGYDHDDHHGHGHHFEHHHHSGHGHHHKHHDHHHLASKALLWPIAGIALLGAAAALVTNPVLLQLGVVSGRRKRRDTVEVTGPDYVSSEDWPLDPYAGQSGKLEVKKDIGKGDAIKKINGRNDYQKKNGDKDSLIITNVNKRFIPIALKLKRN